MLKKMSSAMGIGAILWSTLIKVSYIIGSHVACFSGVNVVAPLIGITCGWLPLASALALRGSIAWLLFGMHPFLVVVYHSSSLIASAYWKSGLVVRLIIPLIAMLIFMVHPTGSVAYAALWLMPVFCAFIADRSILARAFGSTWAAHAFGSVVYLFTKPAIAWSAIIPVALVERALFACALAGCYMIYISVKNVRPSLSFFKKVTA